MSMRDYLEQRERDLERRIAELESDMAHRAQEAFELECARWDDAIKRISELEAENRRVREALARVHQYLCALQTVSDDLGPHVSSKSVDEHEAIARAALSQEDRDGT